MKKKRTYLVHGFNVRDNGASTVLKLARFAKKISGGVVTNIGYGWFGLFSVLFKNKSVAKYIKSETSMAKLCEGEAEVYGIGHSNGCAILVEAVRQGARFDKLLLINPALNVDTVFPPSIEEIVVIHTRKDIPTRTARFFDAIPLIGLIVPNAWGAMGAVGYTGNDPRVRNIDLSYALSGHSDIFKDAKITSHAVPILELIYKD